MQQKNTLKGVLLMLLSALLVCTGQLCWKLANTAGGAPLVAGYSLVGAALACTGFLLLGLSSFVMIVALRYGDLSVLHPVLRAGSVLSLGLGALVLHERITLTKALGVLVILAGLFLHTGGREEGKTA